MYQVDAQIERISKGLDKQIKDAIEKEDTKRAKQVAVRLARTYFAPFEPDWNHPISSQMAISIQNQIEDEYGIRVPQGKMLDQKTQSLQSTIASAKGNIGG